MDATSTIEFEMPDSSQNFFIEKSFSYGDISQIFVELTILGLIAWVIIKKEFSKK